ncbi:MAG: hypothetical protein L0210_08695, partial [Rhodospirillales bacterium]|nr:hypothetical protein [Rhodospirillales bacterium]
RDGARRWFSAPLGGGMERRITTAILVAAGLTAWFPVVAALAGGREVAPEALWGAVAVLAIMLVVVMLTLWARKAVAARVRSSLELAPAGGFSPQEGRSVLTLVADTALDQAEEAADRLRDAVASLEAGSLSRQTKRRLVAVARSVTGGMFVWRRELERLCL